MLSKVLKRLGGTTLLYDGEKYKSDIYDVVISDGYIENTRFPSSTICEMGRISKKYVVIKWYHLLNMTRVRKTAKGFDNIYCTKEMRILSKEHNLNISEKIPLEGEGEEIWVLVKI